MTPLLDHPQVHRAFAIAALAHEGQTDKVGVDYIEHPIWVATHVSIATPRTQAAALLHDVIEDTDVTVRQLIAAGIGPSVVSDVLLLTKPQKDKNGWVDMEPYRSGVMTSLSATVVKIADTLHNLDPNRGWGSTMPDKKRHEYHANLMVYGEHLARSLHNGAINTFRAFEL